MQHITVTTVYQVPDEVGSELTEALRTDGSLDRLLRFTREREPDSISSSIGPTRPVDPPDTPRQQVIITSYQEISQEVGDELVETIRRDGRQFDHILRFMREHPPQNLCYSIGGMKPDDARSEPHED